MINLLSTEEKSQIRAARVNVRLRRYLFASLLSMATIGVVYMVGIQLANEKKTKATAQYSVSEQQLNQYQEAKATADSYRSNLTMAKKILGSEIVFSTLLTDIAKILPAGTVLTSFNVSTTSVSSAKNGHTQLHARAKSYQGVIDLKNSLENSNLFSDVRISSTNTPDSLDNNKGVSQVYPYEVTFDLVLDPLSGVKK